MQRFGKYRGVVVNVDDPAKRGRIQARIPAMGDADLPWALPCVPGAGPDSGRLVLPPVGAMVWIEFEAGDSDSPIWTGGFWPEGEMPATVERQPS